MFLSVRAVARKTLRVGLLSLIACSGMAHALNLSGITNSHDPSTLVKDDDTYFHFTTGEGVWYSRSTDMVNWGNPGTVFGNSWPSWIDNAVPDFGGHFWAPDNPPVLGGWERLVKRDDMPKGAKPGSQA